MEIIIFDTTRELYRFLKETSAIDELDLFKNTPQKLIPPDNMGYVIISDDGFNVLGAASLYEEGPGIWFNEIFEIIESQRGNGLGRYLYEFIKDDLKPDKIHGFCTTPENKSFWEHMGQKCIDEESGEMLEVLKNK